MDPNREQAMELLTEFTKSDSLIKHALAVEAAMRAYARRFGEDEEKWGVVGLIHDFDYEQNQSWEQHVYVGARILRERGWPEEYVQGMESHANYMNVPRDTNMRKSLFAVDELSGFISAVALVRPSKSIMDVEASSVKKKMKDKAFARSVSREDILEGAKELGIPLEEHISFVIEAMKPVAKDLGLDGSAAR
ncbi:MAG TPA: HDIG domain-containing protein [Chloroflexota bacterium]|nr:HDIG domain-containing protein [Chloroflexota bacterium]